MWCHRLSESMLVVVTEPSKRLLIPAWNITVPSAFCTMAQPLVFNRSNSIAGLPPALASPLERIQKLIVPVLELKLVFGGTTIWLGTLAVKLITPDRVTLPLSVLLASPLDPILKLIVTVLELKLVFGGTTIWLGTLAVKLITPDRVTLPLSVLLASHDAPLFNPSCSCP